MNVIIREAEEKDLPAIISLYSQPDMDNGQVLAGRGKRKKLIGRNTNS